MGDRVIAFSSLERAEARAKSLEAELLQEIAQGARKDAEINFLRGCSSAVSEALGRAEELVGKYDFERIGREDAREFVRILSSVLRELRGVLTQ